MPFRIKLKFLHTAAFMAFLNLTILLVRVGLAYAAGTTLKTSVALS